MIEITKYEGNFEERIKHFKDIIEKSQNIVFFGGAGVSTDSGIKDFRGSNGLYIKNKYKTSPETMLSKSFFYNNPKDFFEFYKSEFNTLDKVPNATHYKLAELEQQNKIKTIITQNIDGLHQQAGSKNVIEIHGTIHKNYCVKCSKKQKDFKIYDANTIFNSKDLIPRCPICNNIIRPGIVLYEESLKNENIDNAFNYLHKADTLIICGTSLTVSPACNFIYEFYGDNIIIINKEPTPFDNYCNLIFRENGSSVFEKL